jgi:Mg2+ and Co2+ transporter CorA
MPDLEGLGLQIEHLEESLLSARPSTLPALAPLMEQLGRIATEVARTREVAERAARKIDELAAAPAPPPPADTGALGDLVHEIAELRTEVAHLRRRISLRAATPDGSP